MDDLFQSPIQSPKAALMILRLHWAASVVIPLVFAAVAIFKHESTSTPPLSINLDYVLVGLLVGTGVVALIGYFARMQIYKRHWQGEAVAPKGYVSGNIVLMALLELPMMVTLMMLIFMPEQVKVLLVPGALVMLLLLVNFPTGKPMRPKRSQ
jgi:hypothetical protein